MRSTWQESLPPSPEGDVCENASLMGLEMQKCICTQQSYSTDDVSAQPCRPQQLNDRLASVR